MHSRLLDVALVVEVRLPQAGGSITRGQGGEAVRVHVDAQRPQGGVVLLVDALSGGQPDDSGSNHCHAHVCRGERVTMGPHPRGRFGLDTSRLKGNGIMSYIMKQCIS